MKSTGAYAKGPRIVIVGCGFGGICLAIKLRAAGLRHFTILERARGIGGVWRDNAYPGAACDVPSRLYSFSFEQTFDWSHRYGRQAEILAYLRHCVDKYALCEHIRFGVEVTGARFSADGGRCWQVDTAGGERFDADILVSAAGLFNRPRLPDIPGIDRFAGDHFHSAVWRHDCPLQHRTVAVIGTGASAIQFVPEIARQAKRLDVYQSSCQYVFPKRDPEKSTTVFPHSFAQKLSARLERLREFLEFEIGIPRRRSELLTRRGERRFHKHLNKSVADPGLREKLTPSFRLGCKRVLISNDWYPALQRPNVSLVDTPIERITGDGVQTRDGALRPAEVIVFSTGFTPSDFLAPMTLTGLDGRKIDDAWRRAGAEAYLGVTLQGFPNFFMLYGPNTNVAGSVIFMLECQANYIVACISALRRSGARLMQVRESAQARHNRRVQRRMHATLLVDPGCNSYYKNAAGKVVTQWPGFMSTYKRKTARVRRGDYRFWR